MLVHRTLNLGSSSEKESESDSCESVSSHGFFSEIQAMFCLRQKDLLRQNGQDRLDDLSTRQIAFVVSGAGAGSYLGAADLQEIGGELEPRLQKPLLRQPLSATRDPCAGCACRLEPIWGLLLLCCCFVAPSVTAWAIFCPFPPLKQLISGITATATARCHLHQSAAFHREIQGSSPQRQGTAREEDQAEAGGEPSNGTGTEE